MTFFLKPSGNLIADNT